MQDGAGQPGWTNDQVKLDLLAGVIHTQGVSVGAAGLLELLTSSDGTLRDLYPQDLRDALRPFLHGKRHALYDPAENREAIGQGRGTGGYWAMDDSWPWFLRVSSLE